MAEDFMGTDKPSLPGSAYDPPPAEFGGETFKPERDRDRLRRQLEIVRRLMSTGAWWTLHNLAVAAGAPEASVSARLRDLRKPKFGGATILREYVARGIWRYRMVLELPHR